MTANINATDDALRAAGAAIGRASLFDDRLTAADAARIAAWAEVIQPTGLTRNQIVDAVTSYYSTPQDRAITVGAAVALAKDARRTSAEREGLTQLGQRQDRNDQRHGLTAGDKALGGLPIGGADGPPVPGAYDVNGAVDRECPYCAAEVMSPCINPTNGSPRRIPCLPRLKQVAA